MSFVVLNMLEFLSLALDDSNLRNITSGVFDFLCRLRDRKIIPTQSVRVCLVLFEGEKKKTSRPSLLLSYVVYCFSMLELCRLGDRQNVPLSVSVRFVLKPTPTRAF